MVDGVHYTEESCGTLVRNLNDSLSTKFKLGKKESFSAPSVSGSSTSTGGDFSFQWALRDRSAQLAVTSTSETIASCYTRVVHQPEGENTAQKGRIPSLRSRERTLLAHGRY
jgi:hypothetical protein